MLIAGLLFDLGVIITCTAFNLAMLIIGRVLLGVAVAFASVAVTLYNSEMAPAHIRGRLNQIFQVRGRHKHGSRLLQKQQVHTRFRSDMHFWQNCSCIQYPPVTGSWMLAACEQLQAHARRWC